MGLIDRAKDKIQDAAGGVRGAEGKGAEGSEPREEKFEPEEVRRRKKPKDDLPQPEDSRPQD